MGDPEKDTHAFWGVPTSNYLILITKYHPANPNWEKFYKVPFKNTNGLVSPRTVEGLFQIKETGQRNAVCDPGVHPREEEESCRQRH